MTRQSIQFTEPNDQWLISQVESKEDSSKSEVVNDLIRRERERQGEIAYLRAKLLQSEQSGISERTPEQIQQEAKKKLNKDNKK